MKDIKKDIEEIITNSDIYDYYSYYSNSDIDYEVQTENMNFLTKELTDYITKSNREAVEGFVDILLDGRGRKTEVWHYELNDANYMEASAFGEYIKIRELEKALETYLSQLNKGDKE